MPKAENRKKPPNLKGLVPGRGNQDRFESGLWNSEQHHHRKTQKQELLERMKTIQKGKNQK